MKKIVVFCLAMLLVFSFVTLAAAETKVDFSGYYRVRGFYNNNFNLANDSDNESKSSYFDQRFRLGVKLRPADNLVMNLNLQALKDNKWGTQASGLTWKNKPGTLGNGAGDAEYNSSFEVYRAYMQVKTGFGQFDLGRMSAGTGGLALAGYGASPIGADRCPFDNEGPRHRIKYTMSSGPFWMTAGYDKFIEKDSDPALNPGGEQELDQDGIFILPKYTFSNGSVNLLFVYNINNSVPGEKIKFYLINPGLRMVFGQFSINTEFQYMSGDMDVADVDLEGLGFYFDANWNYGQGELGAWYLWVQGDDDLADNKRKGMFGSGVDFCPLLLAYDIGGLGVLDLNNAANHWSLGMWLDHNITEKLLLHAAVGYIKMNETKAYGANIDNNYGSEFDLGLVYKIHENLTYEALFGYFMAGDFHKDALGTDVGNAMAFRHVLTMSF